MTAPNRGRCPECGRRAPLTARGLLGAHKGCPGAGLEPLIPAQLERPVIRPVGGGRLDSRGEFAWGHAQHIRFGAGEAHIIKVEDDYTWHAGGESGSSLRWDIALLAAWSACAGQELAPLALSEFELRRTVELVEGRGEPEAIERAVETIRALLRRRSGICWSVRRGKGAHAQDILIKAPSARLIGSSMSAHDTALLGALLGQRTVNRHHGATIKARLGLRGDAVRSIAGRAGKKDEHHHDHDRSATPRL